MDPDPKLLKGKPVSDQIREHVASRVRDIASGRGRAPCLATVIATDDPGARSYARSKAAACRKTGIEDRTLELSPKTGEEDLIKRATTDFLLFTFDHSSVIPRLDRGIQGH